MDFNYKMIGERIRNYRVSKKMTQEELADKATVARSLISRIENGSAVPSLETLIYITNALGVSANDILFDSLEDVEGNAENIIFNDCTSEEREILTENMSSLMQILKNYKITK